MSSTREHGEIAMGTLEIGAVDTKLEVAVIPVSDVDRAKRFYAERRTYSSFAMFKDPDGNSWLLQEVTARLPGRVEANNTAFSSSAELAAGLRRAAAAHGEHEKRNGGQHDANWPDWYAEYMVNEQAGKLLPT